ncbi:MAG: diguanylate cyclase [Devosia sp.]
MFDTAAGDPFGIDRFPVGCIATDDTRVIRFANAHAAIQLDRAQDDLLGLGIETLLTPASRIFCDSYVLPILLTKGHCDEVLLTVETGSGTRAPVVVSAWVHGDRPGFVFWSFMRADKRDKLQTEVLASRNLLQKQARSLKELAARDDLTGLMNRREFTRMIAPFSAAANRAAASVVILLLDIDRFKAVNDTYGHLAGDDVLRQLGGAFAPLVGSNELAARYGGEEFIFAVTATNAEAASHFVCRLHKAAASVTGSGAPITVSIGLYCWPPQSGESFKSAVKAADRALYEAKALGRNRTMMMDADGTLVPFG